MSQKSTYKDNAITLIYRFNEKDSTYKTVKISPVPKDGEGNEQTSFFFNVTEGKKGDQSATKKITLRLGLAELAYFSRVFGTVADREIQFPPAS